MRQGIRANGPGHDPPERRPDHRADEARLGRLLERAYTAREARITTVDDALAKLNTALDAIGTPPQRRADHRRLFGACAFAMLVVLLLSPVAHSGLAIGTRHAGQSAAASGRAALPPVTVAASEGDTTGHTPAPNGATQSAVTSETPLRDLLARAGIHASDPPGGSTAPPQH
ncbi:MAG: hypothetical protein M3176_10915 [Chloroflexota bacterium]|nr:hypothetical protein [Chloroflexota bacterium]MDQ6907329.1 hypothetical protein [Chloroflexota bacterium]